MLRRPTTIVRSTVPAVGTVLVEPDTDAPPTSVRRVTILVESDIQAALDTSLDAIARTRGYAWGIIPANVGKIQIWLQPQQYISAIAREDGLANCTVIIEYFDALPGGI